MPEIQEMHEKAKIITSLGKPIVTPDPPAQQMQENHNCRTFILFYIAATWSAMWSGLVPCMSHEKLT